MRLFASVVCWLACSVACVGSAAGPGPEVTRSRSSALSSGTPTSGGDASSVRLTSERAVHFRRVSDLRFSPDGSRLVCVVSEAAEAAPESHLWIADARRGDLRQLTFSSKSERAPRWAPNGKALAFLSTRSGDTQVYVMELDGGEGLPVSRAEGGVSDYRWSPNGARIAFLSHGPKQDDPRVFDREQDLNRLSVVELASKKVRELTAGAFRVDELAWPSAERLVVAASEHPRNESWDSALYQIDAADGGFNLSARPPQPFSDLTSSPNGSRLAYLGTSAQGPIAHDLFVIDAAGGEARNLSRKLDRAVLEVHWQDDATVLFRAANGFRNVLYRVDLRGSPSRIDLPYSVRAFDVARDGTIAFVGVGFNHLPEVYLRPPTGPLRQVGHLQESGWANVALVDAEIFRVKSFDRTEIESALMTPVDPAQAPARGWPLVLLVHGGPSSNFSADYFWFNAWAQLLAAKGYQVLLVNPRGSIGYGEAFVKANRADLGGGDYKDLIATLDAVLARGHTDAARLGIGGWSYGAEMTQWAIGHTTRFNAAVSGAGVFDQVAEFETENQPADDEWQFGTPWEHPEVFARNSPLTFIRNAKTPTLIVHGDADANNPVGQS